MRRVSITPIRLGLVGIAFYMGAIAWVGIWSYVVKRNDPPGWIMDRAIPDGPYWLEGFAGVLIVSALVWGAAAWAKRKFSK